MAAKDGERSASSATRFTATTPHASSKAKTKTNAGPPLPNNLRFKAQQKSAPAAEGPRKSPPGSSTAAGSAAGAAEAGAAETPEQRVARLRAAHQAARNAKVSRFDQFLAASRPFFDSAHKITVTALVGLTAVATVMTAYTAYDMMKHNRQRKIDFDAAQKQMAADSLEAARLAYMRGDATEEQKELYERATAQGEGVQLPKILSAPTPIRRTTEDEAAGAEARAQPAENKSSKWWGLFSKSSEEGKDKEPTEPLPQRTLEEKRAMLESARAAFEKEKENQKHGGPLDRIGTEAATVDATQTKQADQPKKKGWLW